MRLCSGVVCLAPSPAPSRICVSSLMIVYALRWTTSELGVSYEGFFLSAIMFVVFWSDTAVKTTAYDTDDKQRERDCGQQTRLHIPDDEAHCLPNFLPRSSLPSFDAVPAFPIDALSRAHRPLSQALIRRPPPIGLSKLMDDGQASISIQLHDPADDLYDLCYLLTLITL
jgi:hypothetical protein